MKWLPRSAPNNARDTHPSAVCPGCHISFHGIARDVRNGRRGDQRALAYFTRPHYSVKTRHWRNCTQVIHLGRGRYDLLLHLEVHRHFARSHIIHDCLFHARKVEHIPKIWVDLRFLNSTPADMHACRQQHFEGLRQTKRSELESLANISALPWLFSCKNL